MSMLTEALAYASRGWYVFPCREKPGMPYIKDGTEYTPAEKTPYVSRGLNDATLEEKQIRAWWGKWENALIGVNAGKSGLFVVDIDRKHVNGLDTFTSWNIVDSAGLHAQTPSGGMHIIFTGNGKSSTNATTGIDTRGEGGYFIVPPSKVVEGEFPGEYRKFDDWSRVPGIIPDGLMEKLFPVKDYHYTYRAPAEGVRQLSRNTLHFLSFGAPEGERNSTLFRVLCDFSGCGYTMLQAKDAVAGVVERIGLPKSEFEQILDHAYSKPRTSSIPESIQEKIAAGGKNLASKITYEDQTIIEDALLSCLLVNNPLIAAVMDILHFEDFLTLQNRLIYRSITRLFNKGLKVDYVTLSNEISRETDKVNLDNITKMFANHVTDSDHIITYAQIIREKASIRKVQALMENKDNYLKEGNLLDIVSKMESDLSNIAIYGGAKTTNVLTSEQAVEMVEEKARQMQRGEIDQLQIGFSSYDKHIGGLYSNELVVCAARAGDGKSALALTIMNHVGLDYQKPVALFSLEMSTHESVCRLVSQLTGIQFRDVYRGRLSERERDLYYKAMDRISAAPLYFDDGFGMTIPEIRMKIRKLMENNIKLVIIDQLEQIKGYDGQPAYIQFDKLAYDIKNLTQEFNVPILLNHQLNRGITDRKLKNPEPLLSDLNQAGEKPANQVWVISHVKDEKGKIIQSKIKVLKNRNGPRIEFGVNYIGDRMLFADPAYEEDVHVLDSGTIEEDSYDEDGSPVPSLFGSGKK